MILYQVRSNNPQVDEEFNDKDTAKTLAETLQNANLITWNVHPNLPEALPENVYRSCALENWNGSNWESINIF